MEALLQFVDEQKSHGNNKERERERETMDEGTAVIVDEKIEHNC